MNKLIKYISIFFLGAIAIGCDEEDNTGDSTLVKSNPSLAINIPNPAANFIEKDSTFTYVVTLSEPQISDVIVYLKTVGGTATEGDDFSIAGVTIPAGRTSANVNIKVNADDLPEETETFTVQISDSRTANASVSPKTVEFTIMNVSEGDLPLSMSWASNYYNTAGELIAPADVADMIFYITDANGDIVDAADGAAFESYVLEESLPDGDYLLKAGIYATVDPGDLGDLPVLDLSLDFFQVGKIGETTLVYPSAMSGVLCDWNIYTMAKVTKVGSSYTVSRVGEFDFNLNTFTGPYKADEPGYDVYDVEFSIKDCSTITNNNFWDGGFEVDYELDADAGTIAIPLTELDASAFGLGDITVEGSGTFDAVTGEMVVDYVVKQVSSGDTVEENTHTFTKP